MAEGIRAKNDRIVKEKRIREATSDLYFTYAFQLVAALELKSPAAK